MLDHLRPQYAKHFRCIGTDCEDTCCHGLDVVVDKSAYERFNAPRLRHLLEQFEEIEGNQTDSRYARVKLTPAFRCPLLSSNRLCSIQQQYGEAYLPEVCRSYPRISRRIDGLPETALLLSCPEAARLVLLNQELIPAVTNRGLSRYEEFLHPADVRANGSPHQFLWEIRGFTLLLLHDRSYEPWERVFILGMFCKRLEEVTAYDQSVGIHWLLRNYACMLENGSLRDLMKGLPAQASLQLADVIAITDGYLKIIDGSHIRFRECTRDFLQGIGHEPDSTLESLVPAYVTAHATHYRPFIDAHPFLLENYLVNYVFRTRFPFGIDSMGKPSCPKTEFLNMCLRFGVMKSMLIGMAGHYGEAFSTDHVVKLVSSFCRVVEHCPELPSPGLSAADDTARIAALLKN